MEAATPLRKPLVRAVGDTLAIEHLVVDDDSAARLVRERHEAGEDPAKTVAQAIGIGVRVLDREQAAANAEYVKTEFAKVSKEVEQAFGERAHAVAEVFGEKVDEVFAADGGRLAKELERHFSDGSSSAVQHRVREVMTEAAQRLREDLLRQFSSGGDRNPLADFKRGAVEAINQAAQRSDATQRALLDRLAELEKQLVALHAERERREQLEEERERGTAKGRTFEEQVADALDAIAEAQGDVAEAVGDLKGATGKSGDVLVALEACSGPARGRIVFEAKTRRLSRPETRKELERGMEERDADFGVLVLPSQDKLPAKLHPLREYDGNKLVVTYDPEEGSTLALEIGYRLARARVLMSRSGADGVDAAAIHDSAQRAVAALEDVRLVKSQLSGAKTSIDRARELLDAMASQARAHVSEIEALVRDGQSDEQSQTSLEY